MRPDKTGAATLGLSARVQPPAQAQQALIVRAYGLGLRDLEVDFIHLPGPQLVTEILMGCVEGAERERIWDLEVGQRLAALIRAALGPGQTALNFDLSCQNPDCARRMDLDLSLEELAEIEQAYTQPGLVVRGTSNLSLRRPTGRDQLAWQQAAAAGRPLTIGQIVRGLVVEPVAGQPEQPLSAPVLRACEDALDAGDPLVNFVLQVTCPYCQQAGEYSVDLQSVALGHLRQTQSRLLQDVHTLAGRYHWTESQIMALPGWRRNHYLSLIQKETESRA